MTRTQVMIAALILSLFVFAVATKPLRGGPDDPNMGKCYRIVDYRGGMAGGYQYEEIPCP